MTFISQSVKSKSTVKNIATDDLTIGSVGVRKLIMAGALATDSFQIRNSADSDYVFLVAGNGNVIARGRGTGANSIAIGSSVFGTSSTGFQNSAFGDNCFNKSTSGTGNSGFGYNSGGSLTTGSNNSLFGIRSGNSINSGGGNVCLGYQAGDTITSGANNIVIRGTGGMTTGGTNVVIGTKLVPATDSSDHVIISDNSGNAAIIKDANDNIYFGDESALATTATNGFNYVRGGAGVPTGVPATSVTGHVPMYVDFTNNKMYFYSGGAWQLLN